VILGGDLNAVQGEKRFNTISQLWNVGPSQGQMQFANAHGKAPGKAFQATRKHNTLDYILVGSQTDQPVASQVVAFQVLTEVLETDHSPTGIFADVLIPRASEARGNAAPDQGGGVVPGTESVPPVIRISIRAAPPPALQQFSSEQVEHIREAVNRSLRCIPPSTTFTEAYCASFQAEVRLMRKRVCEGDAITSPTAQL